MSQTNDNFDLKAPKLLDKREAKYSSNVTSPYVDVAEANAFIPLAYRSRFLKVVVLKNTRPTIYWYKNGTADGDLEEMIGVVYTGTNTEIIRGNGSVGSLRGQNGISKTDDLTDSDTKTRTTFELGGDLIKDTVLRLKDLLTNGNPNKFTILTEALGNLLQIGQKSFDVFNAQDVAGKKYTGLNSNGIVAVLQAFSQQDLDTGIANGIGFYMRALVQVLYDSDTATNAGGVRIGINYPSSIDNNAYPAPPVSADKTAYIDLGQDNTRSDDAYCALYAKYVDVYSKYVNLVNGYLLLKQMTTTQINAIPSGDKKLGMMLFNSTTQDIMVYNGTIMCAVPKGIRGSLTHDFGIVASNTSQEQTFTVTGAGDGDMVILGLQNSAMNNTGMNFTAWVSAANTVTIRCNNYSSVDINPGIAIFNVFVIK